MLRRERGSVKQRSWSMLVNTSPVVAYFAVWENPQTRIAFLPAGSECLQFQVKETVTRAP
jgi:hypothetical protein